jgi:EAL domain-containing protein (putative c-di-GMP-specific phosphodiesterase class I)
MNMSAEQIRAGLRNGEFVPFFQPVVTLHTGEVSGVEVLARWRHESLGIVPPGAFIATAEQEGLIGELTTMLIGKAFTAVRVLPDPQWLAINISPHLLRDLQLPKRIREAAEATAFPLNRVVIEITESAWWRTLSTRKRSRWNSRRKDAAWHLMISVRATPACFIYSPYPLMN